MLIVDLVSVLMCRGTEFHVLVLRSVIYVIWCVGALVLDGCAGM